jgi:hypothetical protein
MTISDDPHDFEVEDKESILCKMVLLRKNYTNPSGTGG